MQNSNRKLAIPIILSILAFSVFSAPVNIGHASTILIDPDLTAAINSGKPTVQFVVTYDHQPTSSDIAYLSSLGVKFAVMDQLPMALVIGTPSQASAISQQPGLLSLWNNSPQVSYAQVSQTTHSYGTVPVSTSWWLDTMNVRPAWSQGYKGQGVGIAIVDSGVDATNPTLGYRFTATGLSQAPYRVIQNVKVADIGEIPSNEPIGPDQIYLENQPNTDTTGGHGTGTSSSAAGTGGGSNGVYMGVAPEANIIGLGAGDTIVIFFVIASFNYILAHRVQYNIRVNSNSWGPASSCEACFSPNDPVNVASKKMHDAGIAVFFSAGNSGPGDGTIGGYAVHPWVVGVGASQISKGLTRFSSRGFSSNSSRWPMIVAPGENVIAGKALTGATDNSLNAPQDSGNILPAYYPYYTTFGGTSAASPLTAGAAAVLLSAKPTLTPDQVKSTLTGTTDPMPGYLPFQQGSGHVNVARAVQYAVSGNFKPGTVTVENRGVQVYNLKAFEAVGLAVPLASTPVDNNFPVFSGALYFNVTVSWQIPSGPGGWIVRLYAPNDARVLGTRLAGGVATLNGILSSPGSTSVSFSISPSSTITSYNWPGQSMGTWDVVVFNTETAEAYSVNVQVHYATGGTMHLGNGSNGHDSHNVEIDEHGNADSSGTVDAIFQSYDGTTQGIQSVGTATAGTALAVASTLVQPQGQVVQRVDLVTRDANGNVVQWLDGWVTTKTDIQNRISQVQTALLTATPSQATTLQAELAQLNSALTNAPLTEG